MKTKILFCLLTIALSCSGLSRPALAQEIEAKTKTETFESINKAFKEAMSGAQKAAAEEAQQLIADYEKRLEDAETDEEKEAIEKEGMPPMPMFNPMAQPFVAEYSRRFLDYAIADAQKTDAVYALSAAIGTSLGPDGEAKTWEPAIEAFQKQFIESEKIGGLIRTLGRYDDPSALAALQSVTFHNPSRFLQGLALKSLITSHENAVQTAERLEKNKRARRVAEERDGKDAVEATLAALPDLKANLEKFQTRLRADYNDIFPDLSIGQPAPESVSKKLDGAKAQLSDYSGRVVVLDFWATWCGPCVAMIPHETEMVEKFSDKPFSLISISADDELETLTDFLAETEMPWDHWWAGDDEALTQKWDIQHYPTIYVIDAKGIIRFKDVRGEELEAAVDELLAEMESSDK